MYYFYRMQNVGVTITYATVQNIVTKLGENHDRKVLPRASEFEADLSFDDGHYSSEEESVSSVESDESTMAPESSHMEGMVTINF